jgi:hypothetical protein
VLIKYTRFTILWTVLIKYTHFTILWTVLIKYTHFTILVHYPHDDKKRFNKSDVLLTVHLSIILATDQLNEQILIL